MALTVTGAGKGKGARPSRERMALEFVGRLYDAAVDPGLWPSVLTDLADLVGGAGTLFFMQDDRTGGVPFALHGRLDEDALASYVRHFVGIDVRLQTLARQPPMRIVSDESIVQTDAYRSSEIYNDFFLRWDCPKVLGLIVHKGDGKLAGFAVQGSRARSPFGRDEMDMLGMIAPHLERAARIHIELVGRQEVERGFWEALDKLSVGVLLVDVRGRLREANRPARELLARRDGVIAMAGGELQASTQSETTALRRLLAEASLASGGRGLDAGGTLGVSRPSGKRPLVLHVGPVPRTTPRLGPDAVGALVIVADPDAPPELPAAAVRRLYDLTPAEAALARELLAGATLAESAERLGVSVNTVRTHLKHAMDKLDVKRQSDLVRVLLRGAALMGDRTPQP